MFLYQNIANVLPLILRSLPVYLDLFTPRMDGSRVKDQQELDTKIRDNVLQFHGTDTVNVNPIRLSIQIKANLCGRLWNIIQLGLINTKIFLL